MAAVTPKVMYARGRTGDLPVAGEKTQLNPFLPSTFIVRLFIYGCTNLTADLTIQLRDVADTTTYGTVTVATGAQAGEAFVCKEIGFQIPNVPLMLKPVGGSAGTKGIVGIEYL
jgi:hypothetical protein